MEEYILYKLLNVLLVILMSTATEEISNTTKQISDFSVPQLTRIATERSVGMRSFQSST